MIAGLLAVWCALQETGGDRISQALRWLEDEDPVVREIGARELKAQGAAARPALEELLRRRGAFELYGVIRDIERRAGDLALPEVPVAYLRDTVRTPGADDYLRTRLVDVFKAARGGNHQRAYDLANALLLLEPQSPHADLLARLRQHFDIMITQASIARSWVVSPADSPDVDAGEFLFRLENRFKGTVRLICSTEAEARGNPPVLQVQMRSLKVHPDGTVAQTLKETAVPVENEIPIALGAQWERAVRVDLTTGFPEDGDCLRLCSVGGFLEPREVRIFSASIRRRILFEPARVVILPMKHRGVRLAPARAFREALTSGDAEIEAAACLASIGHPEFIQVLAEVIDAYERTVGGDAGDRRRRLLVLMADRDCGTDPGTWRAFLESWKRREAATRSPDGK